MLKLISANQIAFGALVYPCVIGKNGLTHNKKEGDLSTPIGKFAIECVYVRRDKVPILDTKLKTIAIDKNLGWCDDPNCLAYNEPVRLPHDGSFEYMWRDDNLYDIVLPLILPKPYQGSAMFIHCKNDETTTYTKGCIALDKHDLLEILKMVPGVRLELTTY